MFEDIDGVEVIVDDLLIWGTTEEEHDRRLKEVLERAKQRNLKLNRDKSQIKHQLCWPHHRKRWSKVRPQESGSNCELKYSNRERRITAISRHDNLPVQVHPELFTSICTPSDPARKVHRMALGT